MKKVYLAILGVTISLAVFSQTSYYINDNSMTGDVFTSAVGNDANTGTAASPFATLNKAISVATSGSVIYVDAGTYAEDVIVNKSVTILGVQNGVNPGTLLNRGAESVFVPVSAADPINRVVIRLKANNIVIDGLTVDGDNPSLSGSVILNGVDINAGMGFAKLTESLAHNNIVIRNNIIKNFYRYGVFFQSTTALPLSGNLIEKNHIDNISAQNVAGNTGRTGRGVALFNNGYASVKNNVFTRNYIGILLQSNNAPSSGTYFITGNKMETYSRGMVINTLIGLANNYLVNENEITTANLNTWNVPGSSTVNNNVGVFVFGIYNNAGLNFTNNMIDGTWKGFFFNDIINLMPVNNNSITGTLSYAIEYSHFIYESYVAASCNWYGSAAVQNFINKLTLSTVESIPWLTNGTDNSAATGFQPVANSCDGYPTLVTLNGYTHVTCNGVNNGTINITITYGKAPTVFTWTKDGDPGFISHDEDPTNLSPGNYHLALIDGNGSTLYITDTAANGPGTIDVTITEPTVLTASATGTNNLCFGETNGSASVLAGGGTAPYTYLWSNGATSSSISNLAAGTYSVTVTDANGCTSNASITMTENPEINISICAGPTRTIYTGTTNGVGPFGPQSVNLTSSVSGGTPGYIYSWSPAAGLNDATIANPIANPAVTTNYTLTVTDIKGCTKSLNITINVLPLAAAVCSGNGNNVKFNVCHVPPGNPGNAHNICISANALGAHLTGGSNGHNNCYLGPCDIICVNTGSNTLLRGNTSSKTEVTFVEEGIYNEFSVKLYPNPSATTFELKIISNGSQNATSIRITDITGKPVELFQNIIVGKILRFGTAYHKGIYFAEVIQGDNKKMIKLVKL